MNAQSAYRRAAHFYRTVEVTASAENPRQRLELTLGAILAALAAAAHAVEADNPAHRGEQVGRAMTLISILRAALDHKSAPDFSDRLDALYAYCNRRLLMVSLGETQALQEVTELIVTLKNGWDAVDGAPDELAA